MLILCHAETPAGTFTALYENGMIKRVLFPDEPFSAVSVMTDDTLAFSRQAAEYFEGRRKSFSLPFVMSGTRFMQDVYRATLAIPYGMTATYSDIAFAAGYPRAMRAVGNALHANPLPLIIPCHRVVHKSKTHSAYRGGLSVKRCLLSLEDKYC